MELTKLSRDRVKLSASRWTVPQEYFVSLYNYLVHGYEPGSFWTAVLANDFAGAMLSSHPGNEIAYLKHVVGWMRDSFPRHSHGSHAHVQAWLALSGTERRTQLEQAHLIYSEQDEIMMALRGTKTEQPVLY